MITKIINVFANLGAGLENVDLTPDVGSIGVGADLSYGFKPSRAGWDKVGSYVNFGIESFVSTIAFNETGLVVYKACTPGKKVTITLNKGLADEFEFVATINNACVITYPADVEVDKAYPEMKQYYRIDFMTQPE